MTKAKLILIFTFVNLFSVTICMDKEDKEKSEKAVQSLACIAKNNYLSGAIPILDLQRIIAQYAYEWNLKGQFDNSSGCQQVVFSPNGQYLASRGKNFVTKNPQILIWNFSTKQCVQTFDKSNRGHANEINAIAFSHDNKYLASGSNDTTLKIWDLSNNECHDTFSNHYSIITLQFSPDDQFLASGGGDDSVKIWDVNSSSSIKAFDRNNDGHRHIVWCVTYSPNGLYIASSSQLGEIKIWDLKTNRCINTFDRSNGGHILPTITLSYSANGQYLASGSYDQTIKIWNLNTSSCAHTFDRSNGGHTDAITSVVFSPESAKVLLNENSIDSIGQYLASSSSDNTSKIWDLKTNTCLQTFNSSNGGHTESVSSLVFSPNGEFLVSCCKLVIKIWSSREHELLGAHVSSSNGNS